jgi:phosphoribosylaminoimidazole synthetase
MPGMYSGGDYDLAGFSLGAVERGHALPYLDRQQAGDIIIGLGSSGPHSNGYSLIRKVVEKSGLGWGDDAPFVKERSLAQALMEPTRIYVKPVLPLMKAGLVKGAAHITGGGLIENPPRCIAEGLQATFDWDAWPMPAVFQWMGEVGGISDHELRRTFNCGVGFILIVSAENAEPVLAALLNAGEVAFVCGQLEAA